MITENTTERYWNAIGNFLMHVLAMALILLITLGFTAAMRLVRQYIDTQGASVWLLESLELLLVSVNVVVFVAFLVHAIWTFISTLSTHERKELR